jgi:hypothetical protein
MAGYAVVAVIRDAPVQARDAARAEVPRCSPPDVRAEVLDLTQPRDSAVLRAFTDRWTDLRDQFTQLTWYLVNPEGWR